MRGAGWGKMWHSFRPKNDIWYRWRLNGASAYLRKSRDSWQIAFKTIHFQDRDGEFGGPEAEDPPEGLSLIHAWGSGDSVFLHPFLSAMPYVLRMREKFRVAPGRHCRFTAKLPPLLKFELAPEKILAEEMPFGMSKTFFGENPMSGEICHSLVLAFDHDAPPPGPSAFIYCDVLITNSSKATLELERVIVHPEPLSVYVHQNRLVTDTLELDYTDADCKPRVEKCASSSYRLVSAGARYSAGESFARRGVDFIKDITTI